MSDEPLAPADRLLPALKFLLLSILMLRMLAFTAAALLAFAGHPQADAAIADRAKLPAESQPYAVYLSLSEVPFNESGRLERVLRFVVPSLSSKSYLPDQLPQPVPESQLLRLDLQGLGWEATWAPIIAKHYVPAYRPDLVRTKAVPLVVSGAWFAANITDPEQTADAQYQLLYAGKPPKTEKEFRDFWQVSTKSDLFFGRIEGQSGVAVQRTRLMENHPTANRGYHWQTYDSRIVSGEKDPLENLTARPPKHDASELIAAIPKHANSRAGTLQAYFLANGKGERQEKAPADIVTDSTGIRGVEIKNTLSCISCHEQGLKHPNVDEFRSYITSGARLYAKDKAAQQEIDRYLDSPIAKELERNNEDYAAGVKLCNELTTQENAASFKATVQAWDKPIDIEQAARELYTNGTELKLAIGDYSRTYQLSGRLAALAQGGTISRQQWQQNFYLAQKVMQAWTRGY
jgi:hypothetical protein